MDNCSDSASDLETSHGNREIRLFRNPIVQANNKAMPRIYGYRKGSSKRNVKSRVYDLRANHSRHSALAADLLEVMRVEANSPGRRPVLGQVISAKSFELEELADRVPTPGARGEPTGIVGSIMKSSLPVKAQPRHLILERLRKLSPLPHEEETSHKVRRHTSPLHLPPMPETEGESPPQRIKSQPGEAHSRQASPSRYAKLVQLNSMRSFIVEESDENNTGSESPQSPRDDRPVYEKELRFRVVADTREAATEMDRAPVQASGFLGNTYYFQLGKQEPIYERLRQSRSRSLTGSVSSILDRRLPGKEEIPAFIQGYKPMDIAFDMKALSESPRFRVIVGQSSVYIGEFENGKPQGLGVLTTQRATFEGEFKDGQKLRGTERTSEGVYAGHFCNGLRDDSGQFVWNNGEVYVGDWKNGLKHGQGRWTGSQGNYYEGSWLNNKQEGEGVHCFKGTASLTLGSVYKGQFENFLKHGKGSEELANGDKYEGEYRQGKPNGFGDYTWKDGSKYSGEFQDGLRHGEGVLEKDGNIYRGTDWSHVRCVG